MENNKNIRKNKVLNKVLFYFAISFIFAHLIYLIVTIFTMNKVGDTQIKLFGFNALSGDSISMESLQAFLSSLGGGASSLFSSFTSAVNSMIWLTYISKICQIMFFIFILIFAYNMMKNGLDESFNVVFAFGILSSALIMVNPFELRKAAFKISAITNAKFIETSQILLGTENNNLPNLFENIIKIKTHGYSTIFSLITIALAILLLTIGAILLYKKAIKKKEI